MVRAIGIVSHIARDLISIREYRAFLMKSPVLMDDDLEYDSDGRNYKQRKGQEGQAKVERHGGGGGSPSADSVYSSDLELLLDLNALNKTVILVSEI